jgi:hypothetical protein
VSDCDVCIGGGYDGDQAELFESKTIKARKEHRCCECREIIRTGDLYQSDCGKRDGDFSTYKTCAICAEIRTAFCCGESWLYCSLWDDMREIAFPVLTTASKCFAKLSVHAKAFVLRRWNEWKFSR